MGKITRDIPCNFCLFGNKNTCPSSFLFYFHLSKMHMMISIIFAAVATAMAAQVWTLSDAFISLILILCDADPLFCFQ